MEGLIEFVFALFLVFWLVYTLASIRRIKHDAREMRDTIKQLLEATLELGNGQNRRLWEIANRVGGSNVPVGAPASPRATAPLPGPLDRAH